MFTFVLRRVGMVIPTFIGITILAFALIHLIPGDPIEVMMGERGVDPAMHAEAMKRLGLDQPLPMQYVHYIAVRCTRPRHVDHHQHQRRGRVLRALPGDRRAVAVRARVRARVGCRPA